MAIAEAVKTWREKNGLNRTQVGAEAGVSERTVYRWETHEDSQGPGVVELQRLEARWPGLVAALGLRSEPAA